MIVTTVEVIGEAHVGLYALRSKTRVAITSGNTSVILEPEHVFAAARALLDAQITDGQPPAPASFATSV
jgi:hypothetical protein